MEQPDIDSSLAQARESSSATAVLDAPAVSAPPPRGAGEPLCDPKLQRILELQVPVIVRLAHRTMAIRQIRRLAPGSIIEFDRSVRADLDLLVNNHPVGRGTCVRLGEHFGIRLTRIEDKTQRIKSLGVGGTT